MAAHIYLAEHLEIICSHVVSFERRSSLDLLTLSGKPQAVVRLSACCLASCFPLLFRLENLQVVVNGAWGEDWGYWSRGKMSRLFLYSRFAWLIVRSSLERELCKYYVEISSLQSTLPSPVQFKIGPDVFIFMSVVKQTWSFSGWKTLNSLAAFVWVHSLQSNEGFCWLTEPEKSTNVTERSPLCVSA